MAKSNCKSYNAKVAKEKRKGRRGRCEEVLVQADWTFAVQGVAA
jgi:hypothetical protein